MREIPAGRGGDTKANIPSRVVFIDQRFSVWTLWGVTSNKHSLLRITVLNLTDRLQHASCISCGDEFCPPRKVYHELRCEPRLAASNVVAISEFYWFVEIEYCAHDQRKRRSDSDFDTDICATKVNAKK
jgi:hypothetical protein